MGRSSSISLDPEHEIPCEELRGLVAEHRMPAAQPPSPSAFFSHNLIQVSAGSGSLVSAAWQLTDDVQIFQRGLQTPPLFCAGACAGGASCEFDLEFGIDDPLAVFCGWQRWRVERLLGVDGRLATCEHCLWSVLITSFGVDELLAVLGGWRRWDVERPTNSVRNRRPFRCFGWVAVLVRGAS